MGFLFTLTNLRSLINAMLKNTSFFYLTSFLTCANLFFLEPSFAAENETPKLRIKMHLTQVEREKWIAKYDFSEPITALKFSKVGDYRQRAWKPISPSISVHQENEHELFVSSKPLKSLSIEISAYDQFELNNYAPNIRFSNGGANIYMGFFHGKVLQDQSERNVEMSTHLQGLAGENVIATPKFENSDKGDYAYAYFGPQQPVLNHPLKMIIDPALPSWIRDLLIDVSTKSAQYFETSYQRKLSRSLSLTAAASGFETKGFSLKGGASNGQINYQLSGKTVLSEDPIIRAKMTKLIQLLAAHEMAHIWQNDVKQGGIGTNVPWIHEGGAEAMGADALLKTGLWNKNDFDSFIADRKQECEQLNDAKTAYRYSYACGLRNFLSYDLEISKLWKALILETENSGETYSEAMLEQVIKRLRSSEKN
jgi:hypothetical protein